MSYLYTNQPAAGATAHSPYMAPGQVIQPVVQPGASVYPHSPYIGTTPQPQNLGAPAGAYPGQAHQPSPMVGQTYLPSGGQLTYGAQPAGVTSPMTPAQPTQPFSGNVTAGAVTYTTTTDALGRVTYHHFRYVFD